MQVKNKGYLCNVEKSACLCTRSKNNLVNLFPDMFFKWHWHYFRG